MSIFRDGLLPLLLVAALAGAGVWTRSAGWRSSLVAGVVVLLTAAGLLAGGAHAAAAKYETLSTAPERVGDPELPPPVNTLLRRVHQEMTAIDHPDRFGGDLTVGYHGCTDTLLNVTFFEAARHYRTALPAAGWTITRDDP